MKTAFTELVGCTLPLQLAAMGGIGSVELTAAVSTSGGLGMLTHQLLAPGFDAIPGARGINFTRPDRSQAAEVGEAALRAKVIEFFWAAPDAELVKAAKAEGALVAWQVGSAEEAVAAERADADFVIAQGLEAGGHVRGKVGLLPLLATVLDRVQVRGHRRVQRSRRVQAGAALRAGGGHLVHGSLRRGLAGRTPPGPALRLRGGPGGGPQVGGPVAGVAARPGLRGRPPPGGPLRGPGRGPRDRDQAGCRVGGLADVRTA
jgi:Nitronate monooxygenase